MGSKDIIEHIELDNRLIRPCNFSDGTPGKGYAIFEMKNGEKIVVINIMCRLFMDLIDDPFKSANSTPRISKFQN